MLKKIVIFILCMVAMFISPVSAYYDEDYPPNNPTSIPSRMLKGYGRDVKASSLFNTLKSATTFENVGKADFIFIVDTTGSMGNTINSVRSNLAEFAQTVKDNSVDVRFSIIEFKDITYDGLDSTIVHEFDGNIWTANVASIDAELEVLEDGVFGGGDGPETPTDAFAKLFSGEFQFRADASHFAFLVTDAPAKDSSYDSEIASMSEMISKFSMYSIHTSVVSDSSYQACIDSYSELCSSTGGTFIDIYSDFASSMLNVANWVSDTTVATLRVDVLERGRTEDSYVTVLNPSIPTKISRDSAEEVVIRPIRYFEEPKNIGIICDIAYNKYLDSEGNDVTEASIANLSTDRYIKNGFTADGNTRLILRAQSEKPGTVTFQVPSDLGTTFESLNRYSSENSISIPTTKIADNLYQASAVLISPKDYPPVTYSFPSTAFNVHVSLLASEDSSITEIDKKLEIHATPVVLIHGFTKGADVDGAFGSPSAQYGVRHRLIDAGIDNIPFNYNGSVGPLEVIPSNVLGTGMFKTVVDAFIKKIANGIACTKVDIVVHSMGGLVARRFIQDDKGNRETTRSYKQGMVRRLIFLATPNAGSPWASYLTNPFGKQFDGIIEDPDKLLPHDRAALTVLAGVRPFMYLLPIYKENIVAIKELAYNSSLIKSLGRPSVPTYAICGSVKLGDFVFNTVDDTINNLHPFIAGLIRIIPNLQKPELHIAEDLTARLFWDSMEKSFFGDNGHDAIVGNDSTLSATLKSTVSPGDSHVSLCLNDDVGKLVVALLRGPESMFDTSGVTTSSVSTVSTKASVLSVPENVSVAKTVVASGTTEDSTDEDIDPNTYFVEHFVLSSDIQEFVVYDTESVKLSISPDKEITNDVYVMTEFGAYSRICKATSDDTGKFTATLTFTSQDMGTVNVSCFSQGNENNVYISNTIKLIIQPDISTWELNNAKLEFPDTPNITYTDTSVTDDGMISYEQITLPGTLYTNVSSDVPAGLYLTTSDGNVYNVSAPSMGTEWTSDDVAFVTDEGRVRGLKEGVTTLTASYKGLTASISVDVAAAYIEAADENQPIPEITTSVLPEGTVEEEYQATLTAESVSPVTWIITSGDLVNDLELDEDSGIISGIPVMSGDFYFTVTASNKYGATSKDFVLKIKAAPASEPELDPTPTPDPNPEPEPEPSPEPTPNPEPTPEPESDPEQNSGGIKGHMLMGKARDISSLNASIIALLSSDKSVIAAVLPEVSVDHSGTYSFSDIQLYSNVTPKMTLVWNSFSRNMTASVAELTTADGDEKLVEFYDNDNNTILTVPDDRLVNVNVYFESGKIYAPVISATVSQDSESTLGPSGAGCNSVLLGILLLPMALIFALISYKHPKRN